MMTPAELAAHLRTSERTVARMVTDGCPSIMVGSRRRFDLQAVLRWAGERACQSSNTRTAAGKSLSASTVNAYTAASRQVHLRAMPAGSKPS